MAKQKGGLTGNRPVLLPIAGRGRGRGIPFARPTILPATEIRVQGRGRGRGVVSKLREEHRKRVDEMIDEDQYHLTPSRRTQSPAKDVPTLTQSKLFKRIYILKFECVF